MNRALDKPKEQEQELKLTGDVELITARLIAARKRLAKKLRLAVKQAQNRRTAYE
jgi:hypothetical protein